MLTHIKMFEGKELDTMNKFKYINRKRIISKCVLQKLKITIQI